jgi:hypothetical protein
MKTNSAKKIQLYGRKCMENERTYIARTTSKYINIISVHKYYNHIMMVNNWIK